MDLVRSRTLDLTPNVPLTWQGKSLDSLSDGCQFKTIARDTTLNIHLLSTQYSASQTKLVGAIAYWPWRQQRVTLKWKYHTKIRMAVPNTLLKLDLDH